jgi:hypothetical protein
VLYHHCFSSLHWNLQLKVHESKGGLKLNETYQFLVCDNVNLLGENIHVNTIKKKKMLVSRLVEK